MAGLSHHHNPFVNGLKQPFNPAGFFSPLGMPMLPPHFQAAAAAAATNLHHHHGFYPPNLPSPRLLFPAGVSFPSSANSPPISLIRSGKSSASTSLSLDAAGARAAKMFNIESMLHLHQQQQQQISQNKKSSSPSPKVTPPPVRHRKNKTHRWICP